MKIRVLCSLVAVLSIQACDQGHWFTEFPQGLEGGIYELSQDGTAMDYYDRRTSYRVATNNFVSLDDMIIIIIDEDGSNSYSMEIQLKPGAERKLAAMSARNIGKPMVFALDGLVYMDPIVGQKLTERRFELGFGGKGLAETLIGILSGEVDPEKFDAEEDPEQFLEVLSPEVKDSMKKN